MEFLEARVSLTLTLLESEAPSVAVSDDVSGARITGSFFFPALLSEEVVGRMIRFRCLELILIIDFDSEEGIVHLSVLQ